MEGAGKRAVLRCHPPMRSERAGGALLVAAQLGLPFDVSSAGAVHNSLLTAYAADPVAGRVLENLATAPMQVAKYFMAGDQPAEEWAHYALAIPYYTHFTSPIRRYADVMVHRLLAEVVAARSGGGGGSGGAAAVAAATLAAQCDHCNDRKAAAKKAQEQADYVYLTVLLRDRPLVCEAVVVDINGTEYFDLVVMGLEVKARVYAARCDMEASFSSVDRTLILRAKPHDRHGAHGAHADPVRRLAASLPHGVLPQVTADTRILPSQYADAGVPPPPGAKPANFHTGRNSTTLRHMTRLRVRLVANMVKVPVGYLSLIHI